MIKASLKSMFGRKLRTGLTAFAVVLGVAMVTGAYVVTDTMLAAADKLSANSYSGADAAVSTRRAFETSNDELPAELRGVPDDLVQKIAALPEVAAATGEIDGTARVTDKNGDLLQTTGAPPFAVAFDANSDAARELSPFELKDGSFPARPGEVAIDAGTAEKEGYKPGDRIGIIADGPVEQFTVSGIVSFGGVDSIGAATAVVFSIADGQRLIGKPGEVDSILVKARDGVSSDALQAAIAPVLPADAEVQSAAAQDRFDLGSLEEFIKIIRSVLIGFGFVSLFVGAFIIFNTLSITVAQRTREFGLLRMIGASRRQVMTSVILEAGAIGLMASIIGLGVGLLLALGLTALFKSIGLDLPSAGTVFELRTVIVALIVGVGVTTVAGIAPALRATRIAPVEALREGATMDTRPQSRLSIALTVIATLAGVGLLMYGLFGSDLSVGGRLSSMGVGALLLFIGVAMLSRRIARPLASVLGRPAAAVGGVAGRLARQNAMRNPSRTAVTAAALMIGVALVTFVATLAAAMLNSYRDTLRTELDTDFVVVNQDGFSPFGTDVAAKLAETGVTVTSVREDQALVFGEDESVDGIDPATATSALRFRWTDGSEASVTGLGRDGAIVPESFADEHDLKVGSTFPITTASGDELQLTVRGISDRSEFNPLDLANVLISQEAFDATFEQPRDRYVFATGDVPEDRLAAALEPFPDAELFTQKAFEDDQARQITEFLLFLYVLLALSVIVSLFGIVNTLVLSVFERTRELGMLRAVGMTRRQVRRMIRHESIITALLGGVLGMTVGVFMGALVVQGLREYDVSFALPVGTLIAFLVVAVLAGIVAAILPARRAARLNVLEALQYE